MTALAGVELESLVSEPDALTTRPPPCSHIVDDLIAFSLNCLFVLYQSTNNF